MSAVTGSIVSSKGISLSRAARALRKFVETNTAAKPDTAAYLRRTVAAFNDLLEFHDKIERGEDDNEGNEEIEVEIKGKKKIKEEISVGLDAEQAGGTVREGGDEDFASEKKKKKKKKKKRKRENADERSDIDLSKDKIDGLDEQEKEMNLERETANLVNGEVSSARKKKKRKKSDKEKEID
jgi:hypothetical protein